MLCKTMEDEEICYAGRLQEEANENGEESDLSEQLCGFGSPSAAGCLVALWYVARARRGVASDAFYYRLGWKRKIKAA